MFSKSTLLYALIGFNLVLITGFIIRQSKNRSRLSSLEEKLRLKYRKKHDELSPTVTFGKGDKVTVSFRQVKDRKNQKLQNCINPNTTDPRQKLAAMRACLPLFKEYIPQKKSENLKLVRDVPGLVPKFGEAAAVCDSYPFKDVQWKNLYQTTLKSMNPIAKLGFYSRKIKPELYDDFPNRDPDFDAPHMGIWNMRDYCHVHDILVLHDPQVALAKKYFVTDYHQMSLPRLFVMNKIGQDLMPKISKNMSKLNYIQRLYPIDLRANMFFFKKSSVHYHHKIGEHFACFGQSYNHIPGHGNVIRKDLLNKSAQDWLANFAGHPQCREELNYFVDGYRLHNQKECSEFFKLIRTAEYQTRKRTTPIQFILKAGFGVHRGAGVHLFTEKLEKEILEQYEKGAKCGQITDNNLAQKYLAEPQLYEGHKFDFRIYMLIASVNPLKVYYHDGFLRLSLFRYAKNSTVVASQITNTELSKHFIKNLEAENKTHEGKTPDELRDFQMKTLDELSDYLNQIGRVSNPNWGNDYLRRQFKTAFLSVGKMLEKKLHKSSDLFEMFGVDLMLDSDHKLYILEINASPMVIGTNRRKTDLMLRMMNGLFDITFAQQFSRTKRGIEFIQANRKRIEEAKGKEEIRELKAQFESVYTNEVLPEYEAMLTNNSWELVYDGAKKGAARYHGLLSEECVELVERVTQKSDKQGSKKVKQAKTK